MSRIRVAATALYPLLGGNRDLGFARLAGHGLGNSFFTYFHAAALAEASGATLLAPAWFSLKLGPLLRGEASKRLYWRMFRPHPDELAGYAKLATLLRSYARRVVIRVDGEHPPAVANGEAAGLGGGDDGTDAEGDEGEIGRLQHHFERHIDNDEVAPGDHAHEPDDKKDRTDRQIMIERDFHERLPG